MWNAATEKTRGQNAASHAKRRWFRPPGKPCVRAEHCPLTDQLAGVRGAQTTQTGKYADRQAGRRRQATTGRYADTQTHTQRQTDRQTDRQTHRQTDRHTDTQTHRRTDGKTDTQEAGRQTRTQAHTAHAAQAAHAAHATHPSSSGRHQRGVPPVALRVPVQVVPPPTGSAATTTTTHKLLPDAGTPARGPVQYWNIMTITHTNAARTYIHIHSPLRSIQ